MASWKMYSDAVVGAAPTVRKYVDIGDHNFDEALFLGIFGVGIDYTYDSFSDSAIVSSMDLYRANESGEPEWVREIADARSLLDPEEAHRLANIVLHRANRDLLQPFSFAEANPDWSIDDESALRDALAEFRVLARIEGRLTRDERKEKERLSKKIDRLYRKKHTSKTNPRSNDVEGLTSSVYFHLLRHDPAYSGGKAWIRSAVETFLAGKEPRGNDEKYVHALLRSFEGRQNPCGCTARPNMAGQPKQAAKLLRMSRKQLDSIIARGGKAVGAAKRELDRRSRKRKR